MAMAQQAVAERLLHVGKLDEIERGRDIDEPGLRNCRRHRVDEFGKAARLLDGEIDTLQHLDAVGGCQTASP